MSLNSLSPRQEESHASGQGGFTSQLFVEVKSDLLLKDFSDWGGGPTLLCPITGPLGPAL